MGRMSRCTPSRLTSGPVPRSRPAILSISSTKIIPDCSARATAILVTWSMSTRRLSSSWIMYSIASATRIFRFLLRWPKRPGRMSLMLMSISSIPCEETISKAGKLFSRTSTSTWRSSSLPSRSCARNFSRVRWRFSLATDRSPSSAPGRAGVDGGGSKRSRMRSSAFCSAFSATSSTFSSRTISIEISTRSRIMDFGEARGFHLKEG